MIHISRTKIKEIYSTRTEQNNPIKPVGLWYARKNSWIKFFSQYIDDIKYCKYMYKLKLKYTKFSDINPEKVLRIKNETIFDKFTFKYGFIKKFRSSDIVFSVAIDWKRVVEDYGGIEIIPLIKSRLCMTNDQSIIKKYNDEFKFTDNAKNIYLCFWIDTFSISSGCVWDPMAIKEFKRIYKI